MSLKDFCTRNVVCVGPAATILEAALLMREKHVGDLVVVQDPDRPKAPLGIVTDRDLVLKVIAARLPPESTKVEDVMLVEPRTVRDTDGVLEATEKMEAAAVRRLPVVDATGNLKGMVSIDDLYERLTTELGNLSRVSARQVSKRGGRLLTPNAALELVSKVVAHHPPPTPMPAGSPT